MFFFTVYKHYTYIIHTLYIHYTYIIHTLYIHYTYMHACLHACMHASIHPSIHTYIYIYILNSHFESTVAPPKRPNQNAIFTATSPQGTRGKNNLKVKKTSCEVGHVQCLPFKISLFLLDFTKSYIFLGFPRATARLISHRCQHLRFQLRSRHLAMAMNRADQWTQNLAINVYMYICIYVYMYFSPTAECFGVSAHIAFGVLRGTARPCRLVSPVPGTRVPRTGSGNQGSGQGSGNPGFREPGFGARFQEPKVP